MAAPSKSDLEAGVFGFKGAPFINVTSKDSIDTTTLEYGKDGAPFYGVTGGAAPPVATRVTVTTTVIT
jgi:hypothetical protein